MVPRKTLSGAAQVVASRGSAQARERQHWGPQPEAAPSQGRAESQTAGSRSPKGDGFRERFLSSGPWDGVQAGKSDGWLHRTLQVLAEVESNSTPYAATSARLQ